jgi:predicted peptidase
MRVALTRFFAGLLTLGLGFTTHQESLVLAADPKEAFEPRVFDGPDGLKLPYRLLKPVNHDPEKAYPLVLFLHGAGERGTDNTIQLVHGMADFSSDLNRLRYPCFVMAPQCPAEQKWVEIDWTLDSHEMPAEPSSALKLTLAAMDQLATEFKIDAKRLYVTGLSMGGYGTWDLVQRFPDKFAAAVPVCGGGDEQHAAKLAKLPLWAFHGVHDKAVKPERSRRMIATIQQAGGKPGYTEYPDVGHDSWNRAYSDPHMLSWLFKQKRGD